MATNTTISTLDADSTNQALEKVTLDVGGRKFITLASTLDESHFLSVLVSGQWDHNQQEDGSFFIDADPDLFNDILEYLRRQWMPLYWHREKSHDFARYKALQQEAEYYGIHRLSQWLSQQKYLEAIAVNTSVTRLLLPKNNEGVATPGWKSGLHLDWHEREKYTCCFNKYHTSIRQCDTLCFEERKRCDVPSFKERLLTAIMVDERVVFNQEACRPVSKLIGAGN